MNSLSKNTILIEAYIDDNSIFTISIFDELSKLIIFFTLIKLEYLLQNINLESLLLRQEQSKFNITNLYNIENIKYLIKGSFQEESHIRNYNNLIEILRGLLPSRVL